MQINVCADVCVCVFVCVHMSASVCEDVCGFKVGELWARQALADHFAKLRRPNLTQRFYVKLCVCVCSYICSKMYIICSCIYEYVYVCTCVWSTYSLGVK